MSKFGKFFFSLLTAVVVYSIVVGTLVPPSTSLPEVFGWLDIVKLLPAGFLVAMSGLLANYMDEAATGKRRFFIVWALGTFLTLGYGIALWIIYSAAMSSFMVLGFIPILVFSFLIKYIWYV